MDMVKLAVLAVGASLQMAASDFSIEVGSPSAAMSPSAPAAQKVKNAAFSIRAKDCPDARFSGTALSESAQKQRLQSLVFTAGSVPGAYAVTRSNAQVFGGWVAVITAECGEKTLGVLVPVNAEGVYDRAAAKFVAHEPTPAEMEAALRAMQGASR